VTLIPVMFQRWRDVTFVHWRYPSDVVQRLLPAPLEVETFDGLAWVGLVPFTMSGLRPPGLPALPWLSTFPETNVRTYVRAPNGPTGVWFLSLDAARLAAVLAGRAGYGLRYRWSSMRVDVAGDRVDYRSRRRWPGPVVARCHLRVDVGSPLIEPGKLDRWLTKRHRFYTMIAGRLATATADHPPWSLRRAVLLEFSDDLVSAAGVPAPTESPVVHYSAGTSARIGMWHFAHRTSEGG
jgi:uncharacterized protein